MLVDLQNTTRNQTERQTSAKIFSVETKERLFATIKSNAGQKVIIADEEKSHNTITQKNSQGCPIQVTIHHMGRLGNNMCQYATIYLLSQQDCVKVNQTSLCMH